MKKPKGTPAIKKSLAKMKRFAREEDRIYKIQESIAQKAFGKLVKRLKRKKSKSAS
jgi:hypothetical protein